MENNKIKELENFANDFNKRLQLSELELKDNDNAIFKKLNSKNVIRRNMQKKLNSLSTSPIRSKSQFKFRSVIKIVI